MKQFDEFIEQGTAKSITPDKEKAKNFILESERKLNSLKTNIEKIGVENNNANDFVEYCYDLLMYVVRARLSIDGYSCSGIGAHEAEVAYTKNMKLKENDIEFLDKLRYYRNRILYYGKQFDKEYAEKVIIFTKRIYPKLKEQTKP